MRIVTLLPSATEIVCALGLEADIVGISHECDFPAAVRDRPRIVRPAIDSARLTGAEIHARVLRAVAGGTPLYGVDREALGALRPDLVITQDLCEVCALPGAEIDVAIAALPHPPVVLRLHPHSLADILGDVVRVGAATGRAAEARTLAAGLRARLDRVRDAVAGRTRPSVACLEWLDPPFCAGHWMPEAVATAGGRETLGISTRPSYQISWAEVAAAGPEVIVLVLCGFDVARSIREAGATAACGAWQALSAVRSGRVYVTDAAAYFSRSGPRIVDGVEILGALLHPETASWTTPSGSWARLEAAGSPADVPGARAAQTSRSEGRRDADPGAQGGWGWADASTAKSRS